MQEKLMPSEHRVTSMDDAETRHISNDFGQFILVKIPMIIINDDSSYEYPVVNKAVEAVKEHLETWYDQIKDVELEENTDHANAQQ